MKNLCRICGVVCKGTLCVECEQEAVERAEKQAVQVREDSQETKSPAASGAKPSTNAYGTVYKAN